jgi:hypothetical protein
MLIRSLRIFLAAFTITEQFRPLENIDITWNNVLVKSGSVFQIYTQPLCTSATSAFLIEFSEENKKNFSNALLNINVFSFICYLE